MPLIEVIPITTGAEKPGWAYVPDTGYDPSKQAIVPSGARKRARVSNFATVSAASPSSGNDQLSVREQAKIAKHLAELDKENHKDVQITIPNRPKDPAQRGLRGKITPGVRKILLSQKTWRNYLDDEEASIALQKPSALAKQASSLETIDVDAASEPLETAKTTSPALDPTTAALIHVDMPALPTRAELEVLLSAPPLSYNAARAAPSTMSAPPRRFCEICGYWGRARCMKCGVRVCGLECKAAHEETRCLKFYA